MLRTGNYESVNGKWQRKSLKNGFFLVCVASGPTELLQAYSLGSQAQLNAGLAAWDVSLYAWKIITAMDFLKDGLMMG